MKYATPKALGLLGIAAALALAACNSAGSSNNPSNFPNCTIPGTLTAMYPINGATSVPDSVQTIYVASSVALGSQYQSVVGAPNGSIYAGGGFTQVTLSQIPKPRATPGFANPIYYSSFVGPLASSSAYAILFNNQNSQNCIPVQFQQFTTL